MSGPKQVWLLVNGNWVPAVFQSLKQKDIFSFGDAIEPDLLTVLTASCDAYVLDAGLGAGGWNILTVNKELESLHLDSRLREQERKNKLFGI